MLSSVMLYIIDCAMVFLHVNEYIIQCVVTRQSVCLDRIVKMDREPKAIRIFRASDTIDVLLHAHPQAKNVFHQVGLDTCAQCSVRFDETLQEASVQYGFAVEKVLARLNYVHRQSLVVQNKEDNTNSIHTTVQSF